MYCTSVLRSTYAVDRTTGYNYYDYVSVSILIVQVYITGSIFYTIRCLLYLINFSKNCLWRFYLAIHNPARSYDNMSTALKGLTAQRCTVYVHCVQLYSTLIHFGDQNGLFPVCMDVSYIKVSTRDTCTYTTYEYVCKQFITFNDP